MHKGTWVRTHPAAHPRDVARGAQGAARTFTAKHGDLSERVVTAVTLTADDTRLADTLPSVQVTGAAVGAVWEAVTGQAGVLIRGPVVILLQKPEAACGTPHTSGGSTPSDSSKAHHLYSIAPLPTALHPHPLAGGFSGARQARWGRCILQESILLTSQPRLAVGSLHICPKKYWVQMEIYRQGWPLRHLSFNCEKPEAT